MDIIINGEITIDLSHVIKIDVMIFHEERKQQKHFMMFHHVVAIQAHVSIENL